MGVRVAYGKKGRISAAIASGTIPKDSLIITSDSKESELYFYDANGEMKNISERKQFETLTEAQAWVKTYDCAGHIISVHNGSDWVPYIVSADGKLSPVNAGDISVGDVKVIDGGADHKVTATLTEGSVTLAQLHADVQSAIGKAHSHTNKAELDKIVTGDKAKWDAAEQKAHEHDNKTILDTISQDKVDAWDGAVAKQHEHANKTVLDGISAEKVADWDSKAAGNHEHDITELKQASGYIVFNCGSASVNI